MTGLDVRRYPFEDVPLEQTANELRADAASCYTSEPFAEPLTVSGWPTLEPYASSDCDDTDWHVKLTDVTPDGRSIRVTQGCLRAACRDFLPGAAAPPARKTYLFAIELWPTHHVLLPGHSLRVDVTGSDFPWFARSLNRFGAVRSQAHPRVVTNTPPWAKTPVPATAASGRRDINDGLQSACRPEFDRWPAGGPLNHVGPSRVRSRHLPTR